MNHQGYPDVPPHNARTVTADTLHDAADDMAETPENTVIANVIAEFIHDSEIRVEGTLEPVHEWPPSAALGYGIMLGLKIAEAHGAQFAAAPEEESRTRYFTFGFDHVHAVDGFTYDKDVVVKITAPDPRAVMLETFGQKWSFEYTPETIDLSYFPRGIKELP